MSWESYMRKARDNIATHGRTVICVPGEFAYTVGNSMRPEPLPELLVMGPFDPRTLMVLLNVASDEMVKRGRPLEEGKVELGAPLPTYALPTDPLVKKEVTLQVRNFHDGPYDVMQLVLCDPTGLYPWDPGCAPSYRDVKVWRRLDA